MDPAGPDTLQPSLGTRHTVRMPVSRGFRSGYTLLGIAPVALTRLGCCSVQVCTGKMNLSDEVDLEDYVSRPDKISAAEISAICQEAGMHAVRKNR